MKKLCNTVGFIVFTDRIQTEIGSLHKPGGRRKIPVEAKTSQSQSERLQTDVCGETVGGSAGSQIHVLAGIGHLKWKSGIIGQHPHGIVKNFHAVSGHFQYKRGL